MGTCIGQCNLRKLCVFRQILGSISRRRYASRAGPIFYCCRKSTTARRLLVYTRFQWTGHPTECPPRVRYTWAQSVVRHIDLHHSPAIYPYPESVMAAVLDLARSKSSLEIQCTRYVTGIATRILYALKSNGSGSTKWHINNSRICSRSHP